MTTLERVQGIKERVEEGYDPWNLVYAHLRVMEMRDARTYCDRMWDGGKGDPVWQKMSETITEVILHIREQRGEA